MNKKGIYTLFVVLILALVLSACATPIIVAPKAAAAEPVEPQRGSQFSFGNYIDTGYDLVEIETGQTELKVPVRAEALIPSQFSFGNYIDTGYDLVEIETGQTELKTPVRAEALAPSQFSFGNYIDTGYDLVEIETGMNPFDPAATVARPWGPSYQNGIVEAVAQDDGAVAEPTGFIDLADHEDKRWGPGYEDGLVNPAGPAQSDPLFEMASQAIVRTTWGPSYADTAAASHLSSVETSTPTAFQFDLTKLVGATWGPSYQQ